MTDSLFDFRPCEAKETTGRGETSGPERPVYNHRPTYLQKGGGVGQAIAAAQGGQFTVTGLPAP